VERGLTILLERRPRVRLPLTSLDVREGLALPEGIEKRDRDRAEYRDRGRVLADREADRASGRPS
jgi:hypothetical protein